MESRILPSIIEKYHIRLKLVDSSDADFILDLRTNTTLGNYLSETSPLLSEQLKWIREYKERENQGLEYYFVALSEDGQRLGTTRIYNIKSDCFEIGSWVFSKQAPVDAAIKTDIIGREFGFNILGFNFCKFQVRKANSKVLKYHKGYKPELIGEDDLNYYFKIGKDEFLKHSQKLIKLLS